MANATTPDIQLADRVSKSIKKRDEARNIVVEFNTAKKLAQKAAEESRSEAFKEHGVNTLKEFLAKVQTLYSEDLASVEVFEKAVDEYCAAAEKAKAIMAELDNQ